MINKKKFLIIFIHSIFADNLQDKSKFNNTNHKEKTLDEKINNIVNMKDDISFDDIEVDNDYIEPLVIEPLNVTNDNEEESFYIIYISEFLEEKTTNLNTILSLLKNLENTSFYFLMINDLINSEIIINNNKIILSNGGNILFDNEILYENQEKRKFRFFLSDLQYKFLIQLLIFLKNTNINNRKYEKLLDFFQALDEKKYIKKENNLLHLESKSPMPFNSPLNISKTTPNFSQKNKSKSSKKNKNRSLKIKKPLTLNKNKKPSIKVFQVKKKNPLKKNKITNKKK